MVTILSNTLMAQSVIFKKYNVNDGLPDSSIRSITQDHKGYLWFGTELGLAKYDGYSFKQYLADQNQPNSIAGPYILGLEVDDNGILWVSSSQGLSYYNQNSDDFTVFEHDPNNNNGLSSNLITAIKKGNNNALWIATDQGIDRYNSDTSRFDHFKEIKEVVTGRLDIRALLEVEELLYVGSNKGLFQLNPVNKTVHKIVLEQKKDTVVRAISQDHSGNIWVASKSGLFYFNPLNNEIRKVHLSNELKFVGSLVVDKQNNVWVGSYSQGIFRVSQDFKVINFLPDEGSTTELSGASILSLYQDKSDIIWVGSYRNGLNSFDPNHLTLGTYNNSVSSLSCLPSPVIKSALFLDTERMLIGTDYGLSLVTLDSKNCINFRHETDNLLSPEFDQILEIVKDSNNEYWLATNQGTTNIDIETFRFSRFNQTINFSVTDIVESPQGFIYSTSRGLYKFIRANQQIVKIEPTPYQENLSSLYIADLDIDSNGTIWAASEKGLLKVDSQSENFQQIKANKKEIQNQASTALDIDQEGKIWLTIENHGLFIYNPELKQFENIGEKIGLKIQNGFTGLHSSKGDNIWLTTQNSGLINIDKVRNTAFTLRSTDGLQSDIFSFDAFAESADGRLFFGGMKGFNLFEPSKIHLNKTKPTISLSNFKLFDNTVIPGLDYDGFKIDNHIDDLSILNLSYREKVFGFDFVATHFVAPDDITYAYMLEGFNSDWITTSAQNRGVSYNNISPGEYIFRVKAQTKNGVWSEDNVALKIIVSPAPWLTWWAYTIYAVSFVLATFIFIRKRTKILQARAIHLQQTVDQRTSELVNEKSKVEQLLSRKNEEFANVSHEFRTPLTLILGPLAQILKTNDNPIEIGRLNIIQRNGYRLLRMVDQLLNLETFRIKSITQRTPQAIGNIIKMLTEAFADLAREKNINLTYKSIENINFEFTPDALEKIVVNLLSNAIKYTGQGGEITVSSIRTPANELEIKVQDSGIGIPVENQASIFERYHRVLDENSEQVTGAGIGLALVNELVQAHQGRIEVISELGCGTTFLVYLPIIKEVDDSQVTSHGSDEIIAMELMGLASHSESRPKTKQTFYQSNNSQLPTVLVIEDNQDMRNYIATSINNDYKVITANDGEEGVKAAIKEVPDLIISDVMMPIKDGYQVTHELRCNIVTNHIPIILLTARGDRESRLKGWYEKADEYLTKPFDVEELAIRISNLLSIRDILRQRFNQSLSMLQNGSNETPKNKDISAEEVKQRKFLSKLEKVVSEHYVNPDIRVAEIARKVAMSERQLFRKLKGILDATPTQYLNNYRLVRAAERLTKGEPSSNVAFDVGFASHTYFGKCFKAKYGTTPSKYCS